MANNWDWLDKHEEKVNEERSKDYFNVVEGANRFVLLSHFAPFAQVYNPATGKYRPAEEGDRGASIKGVCWVLQDDVIKQAKLPYVVVKQIRGLSVDPEWAFEVPFPHVLTLNAKGAGTKEVEYTLNPSPRKIELPQAILHELAKKPTPEEMVEKIKGKVSQGNSSAPADEAGEPSAPDYPEEELNPEDIPF